MRVKIGLGRWLLIPETPTERALVGMLVSWTPKITASWDEGSDIIDGEATSKVYIMLDFDEDDNIVNKQ